MTANLQASAAEEMVVLVWCWSLTKKQKKSLVWGEDELVPFGTD